MQSELSLPIKLRKVQVPPIKCQGIKTKLTPWIMENASIGKDGRWIEPFMGSGVVGFNSFVSQAIFNDINPHIVNFYNAIKNDMINDYKIRYYLEFEGHRLSEKGAEHYYFIRDRFNEKQDPLDFLFLSRAGFNGMMRFNSKGAFNIPFCKKNERFSKSYITKIVNQVKNVQIKIRNNDWIFTCKNYAEIIENAKINDFIYCDPPYFGRHVDYFNSWSESNEKKLIDLLQSTKANFMLSTWHSNKYRKNTIIDEYWQDYTIITKEHFYHIGAKESNRNSMVEALITNFDLAPRKDSNFIREEEEKSQQINFFAVHS